jgi:hypothetical protein
MFGMTRPDATPVAPDTNPNPIQGSFNLKKVY